MGEHSPRRRWRTASQEPMSIRLWPAQHAARQQVAQQLEEPYRVVPADGLHENVDITRGCGTVVHVIGMLVHVEHKDWPPPGKRRRVIGGPLVHQALIPRRKGEDHPSRSATLRFPHRGELRSPAVEATEIPRDRLGKSAGRPSPTAQTVKVYLMQDHRVRRNQLLTLEAIDDEVRRLGKIELSELGLNRIEPLHCTDIVVLVTAY